MFHLSLLLALAGARTTADLEPPFYVEEERVVGLWEMGGSAEIHDSYIMLAPPIQYRKGCAWTNVQVPTGDWELTIRMHVHETNGGGGFGVWLVDKYNADGPLNGGPLSFKGLGVIASVSQIPDTSKMRLDVFTLQSSKREETGTPEPACVIPFSRREPFELKLSFVQNTVALSFDGKEHFRDTLRCNLSKRYIGVTAANDRRTSRVDLLGVEFTLLDEVKLEWHGEKIQGTANDQYVPPETMPLLRKPAFNITTEELKAASTGAEVTEATLDRLFDVIEEMNGAVFEVASFSDVNTFVRNSIERFSEKWQKRTMRMVERVRDARDVAGAARNYTELMIRNFKSELQASQKKASGKIMTLAEIFNELSESGIDESGQLSGYVNQVNRSRAVTVIIWLSMAEVVAVVLFFIVVNLPFVKKRMHTDVY